MGVGEFLSSKAESEWIMSERSREMWEMNNYPEGEIQEMVDIYTDRGMDREDAEKVISIMSKYKEFFVDVMMAEELQLQVPEDNYIKDNLREGTVTTPNFITYEQLDAYLFICTNIFLFDNKVWSCFFLLLSWDLYLYLDIFWYRYISRVWKIICLKLHVL